MISWLNEDDVIIVDRGFNDSLNFLHILGIKTELPKCLKKGENNMTLKIAIIR